MSRTLTAALLIAALAAPASNPGGHIRHYTPDDNYDRAIRIRCANGDTKRVPEGRTSTGKCGDVGWIGVRRNEEIWCKYPVPPGFNGWAKVADRRGWHSIPNLWVDGFGCTVRRD